MQHLTIESWVVFLLIGAVAGFIAAKVTRGEGLGLLANLCVGVIGAVLGSWLLRLAGIAIPVPGILGTLVVATIGAILLLGIAGIITLHWRRRRS